MDKELKTIYKKYGEDNVDQLTYALSGGYLTIEDDEAHLIRAFLVNNDADIFKMISRITDDGLEVANNQDKFWNFLHDLNR